MRRARRYLPWGLLVTGEMLRKWFGKGLIFLFLLLGQNGANHFLSRHVWLEHLSLTRPSIERAVIQTEAWLWHMLAQPKRRLPIQFIVLVRTGHFQNCATHGHLTWSPLEQHASACTPRYSLVLIFFKDSPLRPKAPPGVPLWLHGYPIRIKICLSCQLLFVVPFGSVFWPHFAAKSSISSLPLCFVFFNLLRIRKNHGGSQPFSAFLSLSQPWHILISRFKAPRKPGLSGPTPRPWRRPEESAGNSSGQCHEPIIWGWVLDSNCRT